jgi:5-methylcytosine-specific restriction endonuclease McrA
MMKNRPKRSKIWTIPEEEFVSLIKTSLTFKEVLNSLKMAANAGCYKTLHARIAFLGLDVDHITQFQFNKKEYYGANSKSKEEILSLLVENSLIGSGTIRRWILSNKLLTYVCAVCKGPPEWSNQKLSLQLDHINGRSNDHRLSNLRWLCPNCHSQTPTFGRKNRKAKPPALNDRRHTRKIKERPSMSELKELLKTQSFCAVGRSFGVSDNAIRKWLKFYEQRSLL